jgi:hypothetical protein
MTTEILNNLKHNESQINSIEKSKQESKEQLEKDLLTKEKLLIKKSNIKKIAIPENINNTRKLDNEIKNSIVSYFQNEIEKEQTSKVEKKKEELKKLEKEKKK